MIAVDGKKLAAELLLAVAQEARDLTPAPKLVVILAEPDEATEKFVYYKKLRALEAGIVVEVVDVAACRDTTAVQRVITESLPNCDAVIVQLPLPVRFDSDTILKTVPASHDADVLSGQTPVAQILPPVVGAIDLISRAYQVSFTDKKVVVIGRGRLVGEPAARYVTSQGGELTVIDRDSKDKDGDIRAADIIISGAGVPGLLQASDLKPGVVVFDAGTSDSQGSLRGDLDAEAAFVTSLFTPVPGGIGPLTISILLKNVLQLALEHRKK